MPAVLIWVWFLGSIALARRYLWLDSIWVAAWMIFLIIVGVFAIIETFRHPETSAYVGYRRIPRWVVRFFGDDEDSK